LLILTFPFLAVYELDMNPWDSDLETHNEVDKKPKKAKIQVWIGNLDLDIILHLRTKYIGKELRPVVYSKTRTQSMRRHHKLVIP